MERGRAKVIPRSDVALRVAVEECRAVCATADDLRRALRRQFSEVHVLERADALQPPGGPPLLYVSRRAR